MLSFIFLQAPTNRTTNHITLDRTNNNTSRVLVIPARTQPPTHRNRPLYIRLCIRLTRMQHNRTIADILLIRPVISHTMANFSDQPLHRTTVTLLPLHTLHFHHPVTHSSHCTHRFIIPPPVHSTIRPNNSSSLCSSTRSNNIRRSIQTHRLPLPQLALMLIPLNLQPRRNNENHCIIDLDF